MGVQLELLLLLELQLVACYLHWKRLHHGKTNLFHIMQLGHAFVICVRYIIMLRCTTLSVQM